MDFRAAGKNPVCVGRIVADDRNLHYRSGPEFERELAKRAPGSTGADIRRTEGFYDPRDNQAYVRDRGGTL